VTDTQVRRIGTALVGAAALALTCGACRRETARHPAAQPGAEPAVIQVSGAGLSSPESVLFDSAADAYLVSNINGSVFAKDDNGFIARLAPDGRVSALKWIAGGSRGVRLDAPKGMGIRGDTLFVADIDAVRLFDRRSGAPLASVTIPGATFLNDVAVAPDGTVYVTDTGIRSAGNGSTRSGADALWKLGPGHRPVMIARGDDLGGPNGIVADSGGVTMVTLGSGRVLHFDLAGRRSELPKPPDGALDGVVRPADHSLLITSWDANTVYRLTPDGQYTVAVAGATSPADIGWDSMRHRLLIPLLTLNQVEIRELR
jgi:sugar lactone lactonase YvrE